MDKDTNHFSNNPPDADRLVPDSSGLTSNGNRNGIAAPKILYVECHSALREIMAQLLDLMSDYEVAAAQNGLEGVYKARTWQPDLILMGLRMPVMDGFEAIQVLRSNPDTVDIPIIVISPWATAKHKERALAAGANLHITPPVNMNRLLQRIERFLKQGRTHTG